MTRPPITLTAAEWASVQPDGTLWLAWEGTPCMAHEFDSPAEFVQACAPCGTCGDGRHFGVCHDCWAMTTGPWCPNCGGYCGDVHCPYCRVELVGPCQACKGMGAAKFRNCTICDARGTVTLGYAYAIGQPLLLTAENIGHHYFRLAHYGPPETLVDRWAIQLRVVG